MEYGNAAWGLRDTPLEDQLKLTADMGLELLELSIANYDRDFLQADADDAQIGEVKNQFLRHGIRLECGCTGNDFTGDDVPEQIEKVRRVMDISGKLGLRYLRIFAGFRSDRDVYGERFDRMTSALITVAEYGRRRNVLPVVETHGGVTVNGSVLVHSASPTTRVDFWREILRTGVGINYDPANLAAAGAVDPVAFYPLFRDSISYVHLKDFRDVPGGVIPAACGEGRLDWPRLMSALAAYNGPALLEYELTDDIEDGLCRSLAFLRQFKNGK